MNPDHSDVIEAEGDETVTVLRLVPYDTSAAEAVVAWCADSPYSSGWVPAGATDAHAVLAGWHADPDIDGYLLLRGTTPVAYGELWFDAEEDEAELAHLVVDPARRRQGLGRALARELTKHTRGRRFAHAVLRVEPANAAGIACYRSAGFVRESEEDERAFNVGQPAEYQWMRHQQSPPLGMASAVHDEWPRHDGRHGAPPPTR